MLSSVIEYYHALFYFLNGGLFSEFKGLPSERARIQVWSLAQVFLLWNVKHYRHPSFAVDFHMNLRNVSLPHVPIKLNWLGRAGRFGILIALFTIYPVVAFFAALQLCIKQKKLSDLSKQFSAQLLTPDDWFSYWRLNCRLISFMYETTKSQEFEMENKWTFLQKAKAAGFPVTPCLDMDALIIKHVNEEGGLGIHSFKNVLSGGDWLIQPKLRNSSRIRNLLPKDSPFCTFRICTGYNPATDDVSVLCAVFRAGRSNATTDHSCILFDADMKTGEITAGSLQWRRDDDITHHPDTKKKIVGEVIPCVPEMCRLCMEIHKNLVPTVPIVGWDIAEVEGGGLVFLETNLMANLHKGHFDRAEYFRIVAANITALETRQVKAKPSELPVAPRTEFKEAA